MRKRAPPKTTMQQLQLQLQQLLMRLLWLTGAAAAATWYIFYYSMKYRIHQQSLNYGKHR